MDQFVDKSEIQQVIAPDRRRRLFARFARSRKGVAAIEFGMVAVPFFGLLCAMFETAFVFFAQESFDNAVSVVAREIQTNQYNGVSATGTNFLTTAPSGGGTSLCGNLPSFIKCPGSIVLNIQSYSSSSTGWGTVGSGLGTSFYNTSGQNSQNVSLGNYGDIVVFQAYYPMPVYLSVLVASGVNGKGVSNLWANMASGGSQTVLNTGTGLVHAIFSTAVFRNEPQ